MCVGSSNDGRRCDGPRWVHLPWAVLCVAVGSLQIVAGVFYLMSLPVFRLGSNLYAGCWNVLGGIIGGMLVCAGPPGKRRHELLLYLAVATCAINMANLLILELGEWTHLLPESARKVLEEDGYDETPAYIARLTTSLTAAVSALAAFLESQFAFCAMHCCSSNIAAGSRKRGAGGGKADAADLLSRNNDQGTDTEYIITRPKPDSLRKSPNNINSASYAQSWVFESDTGAGDCEGGHDDTTPSLSAGPTSGSSGGPPTPMHNSTAGISGALVSFSRAATPSPRGGRSPAAIYATRQQLQSNLVLQHPPVIPFPPKNPHNPPAQVASDSSADSKSSTRDAEFSRELEAALQLIQELETPSEDHPVCNSSSGLGKQSSGSPTDSEKTLSAGKIRCCDSQSTSGYSSPSRRHLQCGYSIRASDAATVISLHGTRPRRNTSRCVTLLNVDARGDMTLLPVSASSSSTMINKSSLNEDVTPRSSDASSTETLRAVNQPWTTNVRSLLRSRKQVQGPKLPPELEAAIVKSECLAYLTDVELMQRHERNREIQRKIEQRVQKQLSNGTLPHSHHTDSSTVIAETTR